MSETRGRENRTHGSMRRREATTASRASTRRAAEEASRRPYNAPYVKLPANWRILERREFAQAAAGRGFPRAPLPVQSVHSAQENVAIVTSPRARPERVARSHLEQR